MAQAVAELCDVDVRVQHIQNLICTTLNISRQSLASLLSQEGITATLQEFLDGKGNKPGFHASACCAMHGLT